MMATFVGPVTGAGGHGGADGSEAVTVERSTALAQDFPSEIGAGHAGPGGSVELLASSLSARHVARAALSSRNSAPRDGSGPGAGMASLPGRPAAMSSGTMNPNGRAPLNHRRFQMAGFWPSEVFPFRERTSRCPVRRVRARAQSSRCTLVQVVSMLKALLSGLRQTRRRGG